MAKLHDDQRRSASNASAERVRLERKLTAIRDRMDGAHADKLDGKIPEDFWERKMSDWRMEEEQVKMAIGALATQKRGTELRRAKDFRTRQSGPFPVCFAELDGKAKLLGILFSNCR